MGEVYEVKDNTTGGHVALKLMRDPDARRLFRFKREFRAIAELSHPNLVELYDLVFEDARWFYTMELVEGDNLLDALLEDEEPVEDKGEETDNPGALSEMSSDEDETLVTHQGLPAYTPEELERRPAGLRRSRPACDLVAFRGVMGEVLDALEFLHGHNIVHRDIKPSNILINEAGRVKLLDFGLAKEIDQGLQTSPEGTLLGTLAYMSPEQIDGGEVTPASDLYAVGGLMFHLLTGRLPFIGTPMQILMARQTEPAVRLETLAEGVPKALSEICHRLLYMHQESRPTIDEVREALGDDKSSREPPVVTAAGPGERAVFVGRAKELASLEACLERAVGGQLGMALIQGESGLGKSTLAMALSKRARRRGVLCFEGRCYERESLPFVAFDRAMDQMVLTLSGWSTEALAPIIPLLKNVSPVFPAFGLLGGRRKKRKKKPEEGANPREQRQRAFEGLCEIVSVVQKRAPVLFILDDLQWMDTESVELLEALLELSGRVMILGLSRPLVEVVEHPLGRVTRVGSRDILNLSLAAMEMDEIEQLLRESSFDTVEGEVVQKLARQTGGNPFFAVQLASVLSSGSAPGASWSGESMPSVERLVHERLTHILSSDAESLLSLASAAGGATSRSLLKSASGLSGEVFDGALRDLYALRLLKVVPGKAPVPLSGEVRPESGDIRWYDLYHDKIREIFYQELEEDRRRALHRALAEALEASGDRGELDVEALRRHWFQAGERGQGLSYTLEAAEQAERKLAFRRASLLYRQVLDDENFEAPPERVAALWARVGDLCECGGRFDEAAEAYRQALEKAIALDDVPFVLRLRAHLSDSLVASGRIREGREIAGEGLSSLGIKASVSQRWQIARLVWLQVLLAIASRLPARWLEREPSALDREEIGFQDAMVRVWMPLEPLRGAESAMRCELLGLRVGDKSVLQRAMAFRTTLPTLVMRPTPRRLAKSLKDLKQAEEMTRVHDLPLGEALNLLGRGFYLLPTAPSEAQAVFMKSIEAFERQGMHDYHDSCIAQTAYLISLSQQGRNEEAEAWSRANLQRNHPNFLNEIVDRLTLSRIMVSTGRFEEGRRVIDVARDKLGDPSSSALGMLLTVADCLFELVEGRAGAALERWEGMVEPLIASGAGMSNFFRGYWYEFGLEASVSLLRRGELKGRRLKKARSLARFYQGCLLTGLDGYGDASLALIAHLTGDPKRAAKLMARALANTSRDKNPFVRWRILEIAREIGLADASSLTEADALAERHAFVHLDPVMRGG